ncbi:MAG: OmpH family outer membrane protein [Candidatus Hydrogenedentes bacterium]|nr:OmpH family outer membrane protein [Candidatus Hydrogenedentota bacterium]
MKTVTQFAAVASILALGFCALPASAAEGTAVPTASSTDYKIGVVDVEEVLAKYEKLTAEVKTLEAEKDKYQKDIDAKSDALEKEFDAVKNLPESERAVKGEEIQKKIRDFRADFTKMDGELQDKRVKLLARTRQDVIKTIQQVGSAENFHLILQGDSNGRSTVIYFATPIDITARVIEKLNSGAPAAAASGATAPAAASNKRER